jgi:hypothetical protein
MLCGRAGGAATCGPCRSYGKRTERVSHSSLDGAQNAPPTTVHRHPSCRVKEKKNKNHYNDARDSRRLIDNTDVLASLRSDHDAAEPVITMLWNA